MTVAQLTAEQRRRRERIETLISPGPVPNHKQPVGLDHFNLPKTEALCSRVLSLPLNNELGEDQVLEVADAIKDFYS